MPEKELYVDVDSSEAEFNRFVRVFSDDRVLPNRGHLITIVGDSGCGKTSLAHRCASWLHRDQGLPRKGRNAIIVDLHDEDVGDASEERFRLIYSLLVMKLNVEANLAEYWEELNGYTDPRLGYSRLSDLLAERPVAVVILPPTKVTGEIHMYYKIAQNRENIIFLAESGSGEVQREWETVIPVSAVHTSLKLGLLDNGDAWKFVQARMDRSKSSQIPLSITQVELDDMLQKIDSLRNMKALQILFFECYREAVRSGLKVITYEYVERFYMRNSALNLKDLRR
ncbi:unnamed protein product [[Actinomadura] parvosata subsp. kistnae]|uniref:AAA+ ATPase domain-containing protein n=1 Tax=[Actinomadura] parvosata subsp. kistnae TaxID=1909395 RepID=A0A1U9ZQC3_9ACTN|nr:ATP-binding protein [Nonomuraea sp. ATCC 55076]AQZ60154.1 hypothetical protein BKM31_00255 [Nonomuraea sp. ATCC 55076]SPL91381.1 unnamed protein product [Actinomadura parvosata subsp. kistnae]